MRNQRRIVSMGAIAIALSAAAPAWAQESATDGDEGRLDEIVVTAQKRSENLQRAAISVSAVTAEALVDKGVSDVTQLSTMVPALQVGASYGGGSQFTLRGIGNVVLNLNSDTAVVTNVDGVPIGRATSIQGLFYDLERVEVLKGPQGTLYGRNATGGAINIITAKPRYGETSGFLNGSYGNYNAINLAAAINVPLGERTAVRLAGSVNQHDGYYSDGSGDERIRAFRGTIKTDLTDNVTLTFGGDYSTQTGIGFGATIAINDKDSRIGIQDPRSSAIYAGTLAAPAFSFLSPLTALRPRQNNSMWGIYANLDIETSIGTLTILPSLRRTHIDFETVASGFYTATDERDKQETVEVRLVSPNENRLQYIVGGFYMKESNVARVGFNQQYFGAYGTFAPSSRAFAGYARLTYKVTPEFRISLAGRYTTDKRSTTSDVTSGLTLCPPALATTPPNPANFCFGTPTLPYTGTNAPANWINPAGGFFPVVVYPTGAITQITPAPFATSRTFNKFNWRAGVEYDVGPSSLLYATFETGFKAGGFYATTNPDPSFGPETVDSYTIGSKNRFLDGRLQLNVEAFWLQYKGKQASFIVPQVGGTTFATFNVGASRIRGFEIDALARVTRNTTLNLNIQYLDAKETDFQYQAFAAAPATGCQVGIPVGGFFPVNCSGQRSVAAPEWTINAGIEQVFPLANGGNVKFSAQTRYQSSMQTSYDFFPASIEGGYTMSDLYLTYEAPEQKYFVTAFVSNLEDQARATYTQVVPQSASAPAPLSGPLLRTSLTPPRTYGVRVGVKF